MPVSRLTKVVLPAPFGPINAWRAPPLIASEIEFAAMMPPNRLPRLRVSRTGAMSAALPRCRSFGRDDRGCFPTSESRGEPHHRGDPAADPLAADDDDGNEQQPDPELPVARREIGEIVLQQAVDQRAEDAAIEVSGAADDENQEHIGRAFEREHRERGESLRLRQQSAGDTGE